MTEKHDQISKEMAAHSTGERFIHFSLGKEDYAIPLLRVREVIAPPEVTAIPQTPNYFLGIMNLRGQVITVLDLRTKLGIKPLNGPEMAVIIADLGGLCVGIVVDSINSVLSPKADELREKPDLPAAKAAEYVTGVYRGQNKLVLLLDVVKVLSLEDHQSIAASQRKAG